MMFGHITSPPFSLHILFYGIGRIHVWLWPMRKRKEGGVRVPYLVNQRKPLRAVCQQSCRTVWINRVWENKERNPKPETTKETPPFPPHPPTTPAGKKKFNYWMVSKMQQPLWFSDGAHLRTTVQARLLREWNCLTLEWLYWDETDELFY